MKRDGGEVDGRGKMGVLNRRRRGRVNCGWYIKKNLKKDVCRFNNQYQAEASTHLRLIIKGKVFYLTYSL